MHAIDERNKPIDSCQRDLSHLRLHEVDWKGQERSGGKVLSVFRPGQGSPGTNVSAYQASLLSSMEVVLPFGTLLLEVKGADLIVCPHSFL